MSKTVRLDKFLADAGKGTRSEVKKYIQKGLVEINGQTAKKPEQKVGTEDRVLFKGEEITREPEYVYYLLHKPAGYVSATEDRRDRTVMELIPSHRKGLFPAGRLDKDTEEDKEKLEKGIDIGEKRQTLPARVKLLEKEDISGAGTLRHVRPETLPEVYTELLLTIREGKFHQVKRMMEAVGKPVIYLKRISMGPLVLPEDLKKGECRPLTEEEIRKLKEAGRASGKNPKKC